MDTATLEKCPFSKCLQGWQAAACTRRQISASDDGQFVTDATLKPESKKQAAAAAAASQAQQILVRHPQTCTQSLINARLHGKWGTVTLP